MHSRPDRSHKHRRRLPRVLAILGLLLFVAGYVGSHWIDVDRYRPQIQAALERSTGAQVSLGPMRLALWPRAHVEVGTTSITGSAWRVEARRLQGWANLRALLGGDARLETLTIEGLRADVEQGYFSSGEPGALSPTPPSDAVKALEAPGAALYVEGVLIARGDISLSRLDASVTRAAAELEEVALAPLGDLAGIHLPALALSGTARAELHAGQAEGRFEGRSAGLDAFEALTGSLRGDFWWRDGKFIVNDAQLDSPGLKIHADGNHSAAEGWGIHLYHGAAGTGAAAMLLEMAEPALAAASFTAEDVIFTFGGPAGFRVVQGAVTACDVEVLPAFRANAELRFAGESLQVEAITAPGMLLRGQGQFDGDTAALRVTLAGEVDLAAAPVAALLGRDDLALEGAATVHDVEVELGRAGARLHSGTVTLENAALDWAGTRYTGLSGGIAMSDEGYHLEDLHAHGANVTGAITQAADGYHFDLQGEAPLQMATAWADVEGVSADAGTVSFTHATGRWDTAAGLSQLELEGSVRDGQIAIARGGFAETLKDVRGTFSQAGDRSAVELEAVPVAAGAMALRGEITTSPLTFAGQLSFSPAGLARTFSPAWADLAPADTLTTEMRIEPAAASAYTLSLTRTESPRLKASVTLGREGVSHAEIETEADAGRFFEKAGVGLSGSGPVAIRVSFAEEGLSGSADFTGATVAAGTALEKEAGLPMRLAVPPGAERATLAVLDQAVALELASGTVRAPALDLDLAGLSPLLRGGGQLGGRVRGAADLGKASAQLTLHEVTADLGPELNFSGIDGALDVAEGHWQFDGVRVRGASSDFTLDARWSAGNEWSGRIAGREIDLNPLIALWGSFAGPGPGANAADGPGGHLTVTAEALRYQRAQFEDVSAEVHFGSGQMRAEQAELGGYGGTARGQLAYEMGSGMLALNFTVDAMDLRLLDDMVFSEARGLAGPASGTLDVSFPVGAETSPMAGLTGHIAYRASNGAYGRLGHATRLLALIKTAEIFRLGVPSLRDDGLTFKETEGRLSAASGVVTIEELTVRDTSYALQGAGTIDYVSQATDVEVHVHLLETVTGVVGAVPVLRGAADRLRENAGVTVHVTGPPGDPAFAMERGLQPVRRITRGIGGVLGGVLGRGRGAAGDEGAATDE